MSAVTDSPRTLLRPPAVVLAVALAKLAMLLSCASAYWYSGDELYLLSCARRLAWGYVDRGPLSVGLLALVEKTYGESLLSMRVVPALTGTLVVFLAARLARRFGAGVLGQGLAALATVVTPALLEPDHFYGSGPLMVLLTTGTLGLFARAIDRERPRPTSAWITVGVGLGLGVLNEPRAVLLAPLLLLFLALSDRSRLREAGPWLAVGIMAVVSAPFAAWENAHRWPAAHLHLVSTSLVLLVAGLPAVFAFVAAKLDPWLGARPWRYPVVAGLLAVFGATLAPLFIPLLTVAKYQSYARTLHLAPHDTPASGLSDRSPLPARYADMFGWRELARTVATVMAAMPPEQREDAVILTSNEREAGAIDLVGDALGLPPAISGGGSYWYWGTLGFSGRVVLAVGGDEGQLRAHWKSVEVATVFGHSLAAAPERHLRIYLCTDPVAPLDVMWGDFKPPD